MSVPTPKDLQRFGRRLHVPVQVPAPDELPAPPPATPTRQAPAPVAFDAVAYEHLLRGSGLHGLAIHLGCILARHARSDGQLDPTPRVAQLARMSGLKLSRVRTSLRVLEYDGWLTRPVVLPGVTEIRMITLRIPPQVCAAPAGPS